MDEENITSGTSGFDFKAAGYLVSIASVFLIGAVAWPDPQDPSWARSVLIAGMVTSIIGMGLRYVAHLKEQKEIRKAKASSRS